MPVNPQRIIVVSGPSGAGRSTAIRALEDLGFEVIDNLPLRLLPRLLDGPPLDRPLALGMDVRNRDFSAQGLLDTLTLIRDRTGTDAELVYLDCRLDVLLRRFSETRRRHPMAPAEDPAVGITRELDLLEPLRAKAETLIDTSTMTPHELKAEIGRSLSFAVAARLAVTIRSFSYKRGLPLGGDMVFDCRFLANPYWDPDLRDADGRDPAVAAYVTNDPLFDAFFDRVLDLVRVLLPAYRDEGKAHFSIAFGCTGGRHRSVTVAEKLAAALAAEDWQVSIRHRELDRRSLGEGAGPLPDRKPMEQS